jgi:hypothetical protein
VRNDAFLDLHSFTYRVGTVILKVSGTYPHSETDFLKVSEAYPHSGTDFLKVSGAYPPAGTDILKVSGAYPPTGTDILKVSRVCLNQDSQDYRMRKMELVINIRLRKMKYIIEKITNKAMSRRDIMLVENQATTKTPSRSRDGMWVNGKQRKVKQDEKMKGQRGERNKTQEETNINRLSLTVNRYFPSCSSYNPENPDSDKKCSEDATPSVGKKSVFIFLNLCHLCAFCYHNNHSNHINHSSDKKRNEDATPSGVFLCPFSSTKLNLNQNK